MIHHGTFVSRNSAKLVASKSLLGALCSHLASDAASALNATLDAVGVRVGHTSTLAWEAYEQADGWVELVGWTCGNGLLVAAGCGDAAGEPLYVFSLTPMQACGVGAELLDEETVWSLEVPNAISRALAVQEAV